MPSRAVLLDGVSKKLKQHRRELRQTFGSKSLVVPSTETRFRGEGVFLPAAVRHSYINMAMKLSWTSCLVLSP